MTVLKAHQLHPLASHYYRTSVAPVTSRLVAWSLAPPSLVLARPAHHSTKTSPCNDECLTTNDAAVQYCMPLVSHVCYVAGRARYAVCSWSVRRETVSACCPACRVLDHLLRCNLQLIYSLMMPTCIGHLTAGEHPYYTVDSISPPKSRLTSTWKGSIFTFSFVLSLLCGQPWSMAPSTVFSFVFFSQQKTIFQFQLIWIWLFFHYATRLTVTIHGPLLLCFVGWTWYIC